MMSRAYLEHLFAYAHLPPHLQEISKPFHTLAFHLYDQLPHNPEITISLRLLLQSKDAAVRAKVMKITE